MNSRKAVRLVLPSAITRVNIAMFPVPQANSRELTPRGPAVKKPNSHLSPRRDTNSERLETFAEELLNSWISPLPRGGKKTKKAPPAIADARCRRFAKQLSRRFMRYVGTIARTSAIRIVLEFVAARGQQKNLVPPFNLDSRSCLWSPLPALCRPPAITHLTQLLVPRLSLVASKLARLIARACSFCWSVKSSPRKPPPCFWPRM